MCVLSHPSSFSSLCFRALFLKRALISTASLGQAQGRAADASALLLENIIDSHSCVSEIRTCSSKLRPEFSSQCTAQSSQPCSCSGSFSKDLLTPAGPSNLSQRIPPLYRGIRMKLNRNQSCGSLSARDLFLNLSRDD